VLPYYNTWGDERIAVQHCFFFWCSTGPDTSYGDVVLQPDTDVPTQDTAGAARGSSRPDTPAKGWQWNELYRVMWDPQADPYQIGALTQLVNAPQQHSNITKHQSEIPVTDCQTGRDRAWILRKRVTLPGPMTVMRRLDHRAPEPVRAMTPADVDFRTWPLHSADGAPPISVRQKKIAACAGTCGNGSLRMHR